MTSKTTKEHFLKYAEMAKHYPLNATTLTQKFGDKEKIRQLLEKDEHLNNIPLGQFHLLPHVTVTFFRAGSADGGSAKLTNGKRISLAENVCCAKHILTFHVAKCTPKFME